MEKKQKQPNRTGGRRKRRIALIISAALLVLAIAVTALVLVLGGGKTVMRAGDIKISEEMYAYWLSYSKYRYLAEHGGSANDHLSWWMSDAGDGRTHEDACRAFAESRMAQIITAASLFESLGGSLSEAERKALSDRYEGLLRYEVSTKKEYNRRAKALGFDYATLRKVLLYEKEAELLRSLLAVEGSDIEDYYEASFRHVYIIEVRTVDKHIRNEEGDFEQDLETGEYLRVALTDAERAEAEARTRRIREALTADGSLNAFLALHGEEGLNEDINVLQGRYADGYFFAPNAEFTGKFAQGLPSGSDDIAGGILSQEKLTWREYNAVNSTLFVYVTGGTGDGERPYAEDGNADFFHDLESDAADWLYATEVSERAKSVKIDRKLADAYDLVEMGIDHMLYAN